MSVEGEFYVPDDDVLRELGRMQVLHSQLDHTLRLAIKRMLGISIDDPEYWVKTGGMAAGLRKRAGELIAATYSDDRETGDTLNAVLDDAENVTTLRNRAMHGLWITMPGAAPAVHDRDRDLMMHVTYPIPTVEALANINARIQRIGRTLNYLTRKLLLP